MLSLNECRKYDPKLAGLSDEDLRKVRNELYALGRMALQSYTQKFPKTYPLGISRLKIKTDSL